MSNPAGDLLEITPPTPDEAARDAAAVDEAWRDFWAQPEGSRRLFPPRTGRSLVECCPSGASNEPLLESATPDVPVTIELDEITATPQLICPLPASSPLGELLGPSTAITLESASSPLDAFGPADTFESMIGEPVPSAELSAARCPVPASSPLAELLGPDLPLVREQETIEQMIEREESKPATQGFVRSMKRHLSRELEIFESRISRRLDEAHRSTTVGLYAGIGLGVIGVGLTLFQILKRPPPPPPPPPEPAAEPLLIA